jgi:hypothetical protein
MQTAARYQKQNQSVSHLSQTVWRLKVTRVTTYPHKHWVQRKKGWGNLMTTCFILKMFTFLRHKKRRHRHSRLPAHVARASQPGVCLITETMLSFTRQAATPRWQVPGSPPLQNTIQTILFTVQISLYGQLLWVIQCVVQTFLMV